MRSACVAGSCNETRSKENTVPSTHGSSTDSTGWGCHDGDGGYSNHPYGGMGYGEYIIWNPNGTVSEFNGYPPMCKKDDAGVSAFAAD